MLDKDTVLMYTGLTDNNLDHPVRSQPEAKAVKEARERNEVVSVLLSYTDLEAIFNGSDLEEMEHPERILEALLRMLENEC